MSKYRSFPLTATQTSIYLEQRLNIDNPLFNIGGYIRMSSVDVKRLSNAHKHLVNMEDVFGIRVKVQGDQLSQYIGETRTDELPFIDFSGGADPYTAAKNKVNSIFTSVMEVDNCELFTAALLKLHDEEYWYIGCSHHLIMDGWGFSNWAKRLSEFYNIASQESSPSGDWQEIVAKDIAYREGSLYEKDKAYWTSQELLQDKLLTPYHKAAFNSLKPIPSVRKVLHIDNALFGKLNGLANRLNIQVPNLYMAVLASYFSRAYSKEKLLFGLPIHGRKNFLEKSMVGLFTGENVMLIETDRVDTFYELALQISKSQRSNLRHQRFPLGDLISAVEPNGKINTLFDVCFSYLQIGAGPDFDGRASTLEYVSNGFDKKPLMITAWEYEEYSQIQFDCNRAYFDEKEMDALLERIEAILLNVVEDPYCSIKHLEINLNNDLTVNLSAHKIPFSENLLIHELFENNASKYPNAVALVYEQKEISYSDLNIYANRLAHRLRKLGVGPDILVGIHMERSLGLAIAMLAVLKAGGAYVPLDPDFPKSRLDFMIDNSQLTYLLTGESLLSGLPDINGTLVSLPESISNEFENGFPRFNPERLKAQHSNNIAYVIYSSGSTGQPKGALIEHKALVNRLEWMQNAFSINSSDRTLFKTPYSFDISILELLWPLCFGATSVIANHHGHKDPNYLADLVIENRVSIVNFVPSLLQHFVEYNSQKRLGIRYIFCGGEPLSAKLVKQASDAWPGVEIHNLYGTSEATIDVSHFSCSGLQQESYSPIGKPIQNISLSILNKNLQICPVGIEGELCISGVGVMREYVNNPDLTESKIHKLTLACGDSVSLLRTGDLARYRSDGNIELLGRIDEQVKINGVRIELGEIEHCIQKHPDVDTCVVIAQPQEDNSLKLVAFIKPVDTNFSAEVVSEEVRQKVKGQLPMIMHPHAIVPIEQWPLTPSGKIARRQLPKVELSTDIMAYESPQNATEEKLVRIWGNLLGLDESLISRNSSFFDIGGNSLSIIKLISQILDVFNIELSIRNVYERQILSHLAIYIEQEKLREDIVAHPDSLAQTDEVEILI